MSYLFACGGQLFINEWADKQGSVVVFAPYSPIYKEDLKANCNSFGYKVMVNLFNQSLRKDLIRGLPGIVDWDLNIFCQ